MTRENIEQYLLDNENNIGELNLRYNIGLLKIHPNTDFETCCRQDNINVAKWIIKINTDTNFYTEDNLVLCHIYSSKKMIMLMHENDIKISDIQVIYNHICRYGLIEDIKTLIKNNISFDCKNYKNKIIKNVMHQSPNIDNIKYFVNLFNNDNDNKNITIIYEQMFKIKDISVHEKMFETFSHLMKDVDFYTLFHNACINTNSNLYIWIHQNNPKTTNHFITCDLVLNCFKSLNIDVINFVLKNSLIKEKYQYKHDVLTSVINKCCISNKISLKNKIKIILSIFENCCDLQANYPLWLKWILPLFCEIKQSIYIIKLFNNIEQNNNNTFDNYVSVENLIKPCLDKCIKTCRDNCNYNIIKILSEKTIYYDSVNPINNMIDNCIINKDKHLMSYLCKNVQTWISEHNFSKIMLYCIENNLLNMATNIYNSYKTFIAIGSDFINKYLFTRLVGNHDKIIWTMKLLNHALSDQQNFAIFKIMCEKGYDVSLLWMLDNYVGIDISGDDHFGFKIACKNKHKKIINMMLLIMPDTYSITYNNDGNIIPNIKYDGEICTICYTNHCNCILSCKHEFCSDCVESITNVVPLCPLCRSSMDNYFVIKPFTNEIIISNEIIETMKMAKHDINAQTLNN